MDDRNPRSKLRSMKRRYFLTTAAVYLAIFLFAYLVLEILFMIFEAGPYTRLSAYVVLFIVSGVITDHIINQTLKDRWRREAPDILDSIKAPEPAYISDGTVKETEPEKAGKAGEVRRFHRTQHKELEQEQAAAAVIQSAEEQKDDSAGKEPKENRKKEKTERRFFRRKNKSGKTEDKTETAQSDSNVKQADSASWMKGLDEMDTVEIEDAVQNREKETASSSEPKKSAGNHPAAESRKKAKDEKQKARREKREQVVKHPDSDRMQSSSKPDPKQRKKQRRQSSGKDNQKKSFDRKPGISQKPSSWVGTLEDMDTVEITEAMERISEVSGNQMRKTRT